jgi:hypothetical protein
LAGKFCQKPIIKIIFFWKMKCVWKVSITKCEGKQCQISIVGFQCGAMNIEGWLTISISYLVYTHIWLNLPMGDHHLGYINKFIKKKILSNRKLSIMPSSVSFQLFINHTILMAHHIRSFAIVTFQQIIENYYSNIRKWTSSMKLTMWMMKLITLL